MRMRVVAALAALAMSLVVSPGAAQSYPDRAVTIVVPFAAGGPTDELARRVAQALSTKLKGNFIVQNIAGGGANIGSNHVAHAAPDGYTLLLHNLAISANVTLYKDLSFDTEKDLRPVMFINRNPLVLVGRKSLEPSSLTDLVAWMKTHRAKAAIAGYGTTGHLATALFAEQAKVDIDLIPYRGGAPVMTDLLGDRVDWFFGTPQQVVPQVLAGKLKAYGVTTTDKFPQLPAAASFPQMFGPKLEVQYWQALFAPTGTPDAIVKQLNAALQEMVADPAILKIWTDEGVAAFPPDQRSTAAAQTLFKSEIARWGQVIRDNNIHIEQ
ncbi:MAG TPA: tripartite tricarboxylate transporter substrate binding protein [Xanthobacteraceae bacterium]|nr:tripartite tricarboxylate transporter substrate binding protein [Xanthobacteraceae bacterium]